MNDFFQIILDLIKEIGVPATLVTALGYALWQMFLKYDNENKYNKTLMKNQIDRLADENNAYRKYFLKHVKGMDDSTLEDIFPGYEAKEINPPEKGEGE